MNIGLTNAFIKSPLGIWLPLRSTDGMFLDEVVGTNGNVNVSY